MTPDEVRVRAFLHVAMSEAEAAGEAVESCVDDIERARRRAEATLRVLHDRLSFVEQLALVVARGDAQELAAVAKVLESYVEDRNDG